MGSSSRTRWTTIALRSTGEQPENEKEKKNDPKMEIGKSMRLMRRAPCGPHCNSHFVEKTIRVGYYGMGETLARWREKKKQGENPVRHDRSISHNKNQNKISLKNNEK